MSRTSRPAARRRHRSPKRSPLARPSTRNAPARGPRRQPCRARILPARPGHEREAVGRSRRSTHTVARSPRSHHVGQPLLTNRMAQPRADNRGLEVVCARAGEAVPWGGCTCRSRVPSRQRAANRRDVEVVKWGAGPWGRSSRAGAGHLRVAPPGAAGRDPERDALSRSSPSQDRRAARPEQRLGAPSARRRRREDGTELGDERARIGQSVTS